MVGTYIHCRRAEDGTEFCFPEDEKVSTDELQEKIAEFEDYVQSSDVAAMQSKPLAPLCVLKLLIMHSIEL